jgi:uroporphyrinogen-III synthase
VLQGFTVGITSDRFRQEQAEFFQRSGATVVFGACVRSASLKSSHQLREVTESIIAAPPRRLVAATGTGVRNWLEAADSWGRARALVEALGPVRIYARGAKTRAALEAIGLRSQSIVGSPLMLDVVDEALAGTSAGERVAVLADGSGSAVELARLRSAGVDLRVVASYQWELPDDHRPALRLAEGVISGRVHGVTFTSRPAVANWLRVATEEGIHGPLKEALAGGTVTIGCVGEVCARAVTDEGIDPALVAVPAVAQIASLVRTVQQRLSMTVVRTNTPYGDPAFVLAGTVATIEGESYVLTPTEARLFGALVRRPNVVVSPEELLRSVWNGSAQDPHLIEVVVARLRRRLGSHGSAITMVQRQGYALRL